MEVLVTNGRLLAGIKSCVSIAKVAAVEKRSSIYMYKYHKR